MDEQMKLVGGGTLDRNEYQRVMIKHGNHMPTVVAGYIDLEAQLTALRAALEFYASLEQYDMGDGGERARAALHGQGG